jgi:hypothetical protein
VFESDRTLFVKTTSEDCELFRRSTRGLAHRARMR